MGKQNKPGLVGRLRDLLDTLGRLLNPPPKPVPARVPVRKWPPIQQDRR